LSVVGSRRARSQEPEPADDRQPTTDSNPSPLIVIAGPTGSGKSELALRLAQQLGGEIVNYDSVQIYRGFDIGSAKPPREQRALVPHHLFDIVDADEEFNAADYGRLARQTCASIATPILAGGTFFYLRALLSGLPEMPGRDEAVRARINAISRKPRGPERLHRWLCRIDPISGRKIAPADRHRVERALEVWITSGSPISNWERKAADELPSIKLALRIEKPTLAPMLDARVEAMFRGGLIEETRALLERFPATARPFGTIGYREAVAVIRGEMQEADAIAETRRRTRAYAKRQMTWLRAERNVHWVDATNRDQAFAAALRIIEVER
jgi:tRNA dimethylallyltransferase